MGGRLFYAFFFKVTGGLPVTGTPVGSRTVFVMGDVLTDRQTENRFNSMSMEATVNAFCTWKTKL